MELHILRKTFHQLKNQENSFILNLKTYVLHFPLKNNSLIGLYIIMTIFYMHQTNYNKENVGSTSMGTVTQQHKYETS